MFKQILSFLENTLIVALLIGIVIFALMTTSMLAGMDWSESETYFYFIRRVFALLIGLELIRFLITFNSDTLLEVLIFLLTRQLILMEIDGHYEGLLSVTVSIAILVLLRVFLPRFSTPTRTSV